MLIETPLRQLPTDKLEAVLNFISQLNQGQPISEAYQAMLASEAVLRRNWDTPEEDAAWAYLRKEP